MPNEYDAKCRCAISRQMADPKQGWYTTDTICYWDTQPCNMECRYKIQITGDKEIIQCFKEWIEDAEEVLKEYD